MGGIDYSFEMFVSGDTIVDGHSCKKLYITSAYLGNEPSLNLFLYEEGGKVFQKSVQGSEWALLYDFTLEQGDVIETNDPWYLTKVKAIDTLVFKGEQYRRFTPVPWNL